MNVIPYFLRLAGSSYLLGVMLFWAWSVYAYAAFQLGIRSAATSDRAATLALGLLVMGVVVRSVTRLHLRRKRRIHVSDAYASLDSGQSFVLLLYPFDGSGNPKMMVRWGDVTTAWLLGLLWPIEDVLVASVRSFLPVIALGPSRGPSGAARLPQSQEEWEPLVRDLADRASAIVFLPGPGAGLSWEFDLLTSHYSLARKTIFIRVSSPLTFAERIRAMIARIRGVKPELGLGHGPVPREMGLMLIDGIYFIDQATSGEWEHFYLPLLGGNPSHLGSLVWASSVSRLPGSRLRLFAEAKMNPMPINENNLDVIYERTLQDIRRSRAESACEIPRAIEAVFLVTTLATWWPL